MRGTPFFQAVFIVAAFLLAGWPVYRLTRPAAPTPAASESTPVPAAEGEAVKAAPLEVAVVCASAPTDFQVQCLGQTVLAGRAPQAHFSRLWTATVPPEGTDLIIQARWPASATGNPSAADAAVGANPAAARVTVRFADGRQVEKSVWADANGTVNEVFTIPGAAVEAVP